MKDAKNGYVKTRKTVERAFKSKRDEYNKLASDNLVAQRDVISVIQTEEDRLKNLVDKADLQKLRKDNQKILKDRIEALEKCEHTETEDALLEMKEKDFVALLDTKRVEFAQKKEAERKKIEEKARIEKEKQEAVEKARLEEIEKAKKDKEEALRKADEEKKKEIEEIKTTKVVEHIKEVNKPTVSKPTNELTDKQKEYLVWKKDNEGKFDIELKEDGKMVIYKKVWEFII